MMKKYLPIIIGLLCLVLGGGVGYKLGLQKEDQILNAKLGTIRPLRLNDGSYKFINPLLAYITPSASQESQLGPLENTLTNFINGQKKNGVEDISIYMSELNQGRWIGINEKNQYNPASMLKVVIMVVYLKSAEQDKNLLQTKFAYTQSESSQLDGNNFFARSELKPGTSYTVEDLIGKMIIDSDNGAEVVLLNHIDTNALEVLYSALNIQSPEKVGDNFTISPRVYSLFFRILYSSTYLSHDMSERALDILSQTTFADGIVAGLPKDITISHKFGEYVASTGGQIQNIELHDCGIIYAKDNPYLLCVMTRGSNLDELKLVIKTISSMVYQSYSK